MPITIAANAVVRCEDVRRSFNDGISWVQKWGRLTPASPCPCYRAWRGTLRTLLVITINAKKKRKKTRKGRKSTLW